MFCSFSQTTSQHGYATLSGYGKQNFTYFLYIGLVLSNGLSHQHCLFKWPVRITPLRLSLNSLNVAILIFVKLYAIDVPQIHFINPLLVDLMLVPYFSCCNKHILYSVFTQLIDNFIINSQTRCDIVESKQIQRFQNCFSLL